MQPERRRPWSRTTWLVLAMIALILASETQRIRAQWQGHRERAQQLYLARANGLKLDKVIEQNDLQLSLMLRTTTLDHLAVEKERAIMRRPSTPR